MWFKKILSYIFRRDFTVKHLTPEQKILAEKMIAELDDSQEIQAWTSDCSPSEQIYLSLFPNGVHLCCDNAVSSLSCSQRRNACVGHYGVCCSRC